MSYVCPRCEREFSSPTALRSHISKQGTVTALGVLVHTCKWKNKRYVYVIRPGRNCSPSTFENIRSMRGTIPKGYIFVEEVIK